MYQINCDRCGRRIQPEDGVHIVDQFHNHHLVCRDCDNGEKLASQDMDVGLIHLLLNAQWLTPDLVPSDKLFAAARKYADSTPIN